MDESFSNFTTVQKDLENEKADRKALSETRLTTGVPPLDMVLKGIFRNDLLLLGADSGAGKTELAVHVALANLNGKNKIAFFSLESEPKEVTRRMLYKRLATRFFANKPAGYIPVNYYDWYNAEIDHLFKDFYEEEKEKLKVDTANLLIRYRKDSDFTINTLMKEVTSLKGYSLIIIDHYHHFDIAGDDENAEMKKSIKDIRDMGLLYGIPVLLLAQLRKRDVHAKKASPVPNMDDFLGASELYKNPTKIVLLGSGGPYKPEIGERMFVDDDHKNCITTYINPAKVRHDGSRTKYLIKTLFNVAKNEYLKDFSLGKFISGEWQAFDKNDYPDWAKTKEK